jgi:hypothetical protein
MPRCPDYLNPDNFDHLASSIGLELSDFGVSALSEIIEKIALQILKEASKNAGKNSEIGMDEIISEAQRLGVQIETYPNPDNKIIKSAKLNK